MLTVMKANLRIAAMKAKKFFTNERGDVNVVSIVVLIAVAVVLAILLKGFLGDLIESLIGKIGKKAEGILG